MEFYLTKTVHVNFEKSVNRITETLKEQGFGIISDINVQNTLKEKIGKEIGPYRILGACNPHFAFEALQIDKNIGVMLPCSVIVSFNKSDKTDISIIHPLNTMKVIGNPELEKLADEVTIRLEKALENF